MNQHLFIGLVVFLLSVTSTGRAGPPHGYQVAKFTQTQSAISAKKQKVVPLPKAVSAAKIPSTPANKKDNKAVSAAAKRIKNSIKTKYMVGIGLPINAVLRQNLPKLFYVQPQIDFAPGALWILIKDKNVLITDILKAPTDQTVKERGTIIKKPDIGTEFIVDGYAQLCEMQRRPDASAQASDLKLFGQCEPEECRSQRSSGTEPGSVASRGSSRRSVGNERSCQQRGGGNDLFVRPSANGGRTRDSLLADRSTSKLDACKPYQETPGSDSTLNPAMWSGTGADPRRMEGGDGIIGGEATARLNYGARLLATVMGFRGTYPNGNIHADVVDPPRGSNPERALATSTVTDPTGRFPTLYIQVDEDGEAEVAEPKKPEKDDKPKVPDKAEPPKQEPPKQEPPKPESPKKEPKDKPEDIAGAVTPMNDISCPAELDGCSFCQGHSKHCQEMQMLTRMVLGYKDPLKVQPRDIGPYANPGESAGKSGSVVTNAARPPNQGHRINPADAGSTLFCDCGNCTNNVAAVIMGEVTMPTKAEQCERINSPECNKEGGIMLPGRPEDTLHPADEDDDDDEDD